MSRTAVLCLLAPAVVGTGAFWLATHGYLVHAAVLLVAGVLALLAGSGRALNRGHRAWAAVLAATALGVVGAVAWYGWSLNAKLYDIQRTDDSVLQRGERPPRAAGESAEDLNILLLGADNPNRLVEKPTVAELLADGAWDAGAYRSDTLMVMHVPADRSAAYIVSIPRDSYVRIHDAAGSPQEMNKINAAFSDHGPFGTWRTVEGFTGLRLDHMAIIDFEGFRELTSAVGGVDVYIAETFYDPPAAAGVGAGLGPPRGRAGAAVRAHPLWAGRG